MGNYFGEIIAELCGYIVELYADFSRGVGEFSVAARNLMLLAHALQRDECSLAKPAHVRVLNRVSHRWRIFEV
jgi:hypothetical protein